MNWKNRIRLTLLLWIVVLLAYGQEASNNRASPLAVASMQYKDAYFKIVYSQPAKRGRQIFGKVVPYGQVWRTGANEATEITITKDIQINGTLLKAGTYSVFTIPEKNEWTIIINKDVGLWGAYNYNPKRDEMRFKVTTSAIPSEVYERFTIELIQRNEVADLNLMWDNVKITVPVKFIN
jgi:hypothetical protein